MIDSESEEEEFSADTTKLLNVVHTNTDNCKVVKPVTDETMPRYQHRVHFATDANANSTINGNAVYLPGYSKHLQQISQNKEKKSCRLQLRCDESMTINFPATMDKIPTEFKEECKIVGLQVPDRILTKIVGLVNSAPILQNYSLFFRWYGVAFFLMLYCILANIVTLLLIGLLMYVMEGPTNKGYDLYLLVPVAVANILTFTPCVLFVIFIRYKKRVQTLSLMSRLSQELNKRYHILLYIDTSISSVPALCVVKYNAFECQEYLRGVMKPQANDTYAFAQKRVADLIYKAIPGYVESLHHLTHLTTHQRHAVSGHAACLCQYMEMNNMLVSLGVHKPGDEEIGFDREPEAAGGCFAALVRPSRGAYDAIPLMLDQDDDED